ATLGNRAMCLFSASGVRRVFVDRENTFATAIMIPCELSRMVMADPSAPSRPSEWLNGVIWYVLVPRNVALE
ncbi:hypothetical protein NK904_23975, partial [Salmonella enterica subsp. enterica serovar Typhimurium]|uniref:hypothetical protein n=1 Tax=Salmonella enterica TaxID=28901 RepID=UPI0020A40D05